ncbi:MAG: TonB-dependent receptor [Robiginitomaculum sp.]|nr:TonB-dependent receptor [Robiginitomaculum sp.]
MISSLSILSILPLVKPAHAQNVKTYIIDLPPLSLDRSLEILARQMRISIDFSSHDLSQTQVSSILGVYRQASGLSVVLEGTGFSFELVSKDVFRIVRATQKTSTSPLALAPNTDLFFNDELTDEIIVRATKRPSVMGRLPMSVSVSDSDQLEMLQITDTNALALHTTGMSATNLGPGRNKIFIRGVSDGSFTGRQQATIGAYLDNIRLNFNEPDPYLQLDDISHVEVLKGPQGTLYGAGSLGGLYRVVTNVPDLVDYSAILNLDTSFTKRGGQNGRISSTINLPVIENKLGFRITGYGSYDAGYIDDVRLDKQNVNVVNLFGTRIRMLWNVTDQWEAQAGLNFQDVIAEDTQYYLHEVGEFTRENYVQEPYGDDYINTYLDIKGQFGWGEIVTSTAFIHRVIDIQNDASLGVPTLTNLPVTASVFVRAREINMISNETRFVSRLGGDLDWLLGGFLSQRDESFTSSLTIPGSGAVLPGGAIDGDVAFAERRIGRVNELAFFGETTWHLPFDIDVTGGLRWFYSQEETTSRIGGALGTSIVTRKGTSRDTGFTPKAAISYKRDENMMFFAQMSQGYRVGGINLNSPEGVFFEYDVNIASDDPNDDQNEDLFEPDQLTMFEVGSRFSFRDDSLQVNLSAFSFYWEDIQTDQILPTGFATILNAGYARSKGLEVDVTFQATPNFSLDVNFSYNDPDLVITNPFLSSKVDDHLPMIPKFAGGIIAEYRLTTNSGLQWIFSGDYTYTGRSQLTFAQVDNRDTDPSNMLNLRITLEQPNSWQTAIYVRNVLNEDSNTFAFGNPFSFRTKVLHTPPPPQTIGVLLSKKF